MKGVIFGEMVRWVEDQFSPAVADAMITKAQLPSKGIYTNVGNYPHDEAIVLLQTLTAITGIELPELANRYGYWLAPRFVELYPQMFEGFSDAVTFLRAVDQQHHREVKKLYPDARTPEITAVVDGEELAIFYSSHRPFAEVAFGLINGFINHFGDDLEVVRDTVENGPHTARFHIVRPDGKISAS